VDKAAVAQQVSGERLTTNRSVHSQGSCARERAQWRCSRCNAQTPIGRAALKCRSE
jgi:hypothetical protein